MEGVKWTIRKHAFGTKSLWTHRVDDFSQKISLFYPLLALITLETEKFSNFFWYSPEACFNRDFLNRPALETLLHQKTQWPKTCASVTQKNEGGWRLLLVFKKLHFKTAEHLMLIECAFLRVAQHCFEKF